MWQECVQQGTDQYIEDELSMSRARLENEQENK